MAEQTIKKKFFTKKRLKKLAIWLIIAVIAAMGFLHQYLIHTDSHIKSHIEDNIQTYSQAAEGLAQRPTNSGDFLENINYSETAVQSLTKFSIELLEDNPYYEDIKSELEAVEKLGIQDVKSENGTVRFYHKSRFVIIYSPDSEEVTGAQKAGDGWFYIKSF